jgi:hypothetical protein
VQRRSPVVMELEKLRRFRAKVAPDLSLHQDVNELYKAFSKQQRNITPLEELWRAIAPVQFLDKASVIKYTTQGVVTVKAADASVAWEFDQWLRGGGLASMKKKSKSPIKSVKIEQ